MRSPLADADTTLTARVPALTEAQAERIALEHYAVTAVAQRVAGERDDNFVLNGPTGRHVLKIVHPGEPPEVTDFCTELLAALQQVPGTPCETLVRTASGRPDVNVELPGGMVRRARMTEFIDGRLLRAVRSTPPLRENLGRVLARLGRDLAAVAPPLGPRPLPWDLAQARRVGPMLDELTTVADRRWLAGCLDRFASDTVPRLAPLRRQPVHNDFSADNVFIADDGVTVAGIIDFGDVVTTQLVNDVAVAMVSQLAADGDPLAPALDLVRGYHAVTPLEPAEVELLYDLVRLRIATRLIITEWRARVHPENRTYILRNTALGWQHAALMPASAEPEMRRRLLQACELD